MEYAKANSNLLYGISFLVLLASLFLIEYATFYVIKAYELHWLVLLVVLILCASPFGKNQLIIHSQETAHHLFWPWLLRLFGLQLSLLFVFIGMTLVFEYWLPIEPMSNADIIQATLNTLLKHDGLLPWGLYALYAGGLGYISYLKNQDAHVSNLVSPLFKKKPDSLFSYSLNLQGRSCVFAVLAVTFAFMTLLIAVLITPHAMPLLTGFHGKTMIIVLALVLVGFTPPFKKITKKLLYPNIPLALTIATTLILFAVFIWLLNAFFGEIGETPIKIPRLIQWLERKNPMTLWIIFSAAWWIAWTPLIAGHIVKLSHGYRLRSMMLATLLLPAVLTVFTMIFPGILIGLHTAALTISIIAILAFFYLLIILTEKTALPMMIRSYLPKPGAYKRRDHYFYCRKLFQVMLIVIYVYLPTGISVTVYMTFAFTLSFTLQIPLALLSMLRNFNKHCC